MHRRRRRRRAPARVRSRYGAAPRGRPLRGIRRRKRIVQHLDTYWGGGALCSRRAAAAPPPPRIPGRIAQRVARRCRHRRHRRSWSAARVHGGRGARPQQRRPLPSGQRRRRRGRRRRGGAGDGGRGGRRGRRRRRRRCRFRRRRRAALAGRAAGCARGRLRLGPDRGAAAGVARVGALHRRRPLQRLHRPGPGPRAAVGLHRRGRRGVRRRLALRRARRLLRRRAPAAGRLALDGARRLPRLRLPAGLRRRVGAAAEQLALLRGLHAGCGEARRGRGRHPSMHDARPPARPPPHAAATAARRRPPPAPPRDRRLLSLSHTS